MSIIGPFRAVLRQDAPIHIQRDVGVAQHDLMAQAVDGFLRPILLDAEDGIIAGHGSTLAAIQLGMTDIPTVRVDHLTPVQIRAYVIADNKLAENAGWDRQLLIGAPGSAGKLAITRSYLARPARAPYRARRRYPSRGAFAMAEGR